MDRRAFTTLLLSAAGCWASRALGDEPVTQPDSNAPGSRPNVPLPTWGGKQFWGDELFFQGYHIQENSLTGHFRLLDENNVRRAWGSLAECRVALEEIKVRQGLAPMRGQAIIVLHGLGRNAASMAVMAKFLREQKQYHVVNMVYPTTRGSIADHAARLAHVVAGLEGIDTVHFVTHSLGGLVVRHYLADRQALPEDAPPQRPIGRIVMLGPPNQGAKLAEVFGRYKAFDLVLGPAAANIRDYQQLQKTFATPADFGVIAGGRGAPKGYNPWLTGDNDLVVSVETTRLPGARDFVVLPVIHTLMMDDPTVHEYTLRFLREGHFIAADRRQPIPHAAE